MLKILIVFLSIYFYLNLAFANPQTAIDRMDADVAAGRPLVAHVIVALCDNEYQGIVPVPKAIGDGSNPTTNLYWGAGYGVKTFFRRSKHWQSVAIPQSNNKKILDRVLFKREIIRNNKTARIYVLAEAWQGQYIKEAVQEFLEMSQGYHQEILNLDKEILPIAGNAHLIAYVGHNGLMDFYPPSIANNEQDDNPRGAIILACKSHDYFKDLVGPQTSLLLTTRSFMAPEAYSLEAAISSWFENTDQQKVVSDAAKAYAQYQKISEKSARTVFVFPPNTH